MTVVMPIMYQRYWNTKHRLERQPLWQKIHDKHYCAVPGNKCDPTDRGQPKRFEKWYKLPRAAHRLFWRTHPQK